MNPEWWASKVNIEEPGRLNPTLLRWLLRLIGPVVRIMYRPKFVGEHHLPADRPFLLIANHSAGVAAAEICSFVYCYVQTFGTERKLSALAHPFGFVYGPIRTLLIGLGAVPSTYAYAQKVLASGAGLLVFPGGDYEASRPIWHYNRVDFNRRRGFLRIAREANVAIVPLGISGSHFTAPILWRSNFLLPKLLILPALLGIKRFPLTLLGLIGMILIIYFGLDTFGWWTLGLVWLWFMSLVPFLPFVPSTIRFRFGEAISPEELFTDDDPELNQAYDTVIARIQELVLAKDTAQEQEGLN